MPVKPISLILLVHQEADIIEGVIQNFHEQVISRIPNSEFIVFEDGSTDGTKTILKNIKEKYGLRLNLEEKRRGYTTAMREAFASASKEIIFFSDSDGQHDPSNFWLLYPMLNNYDAVIGWKQQRRDGMMRNTLSTIYNWLISILFRIHLHDIDCGFRLMTKQVVNVLLASQWRLQYCIGSELVIKAASYGFKITEVPIQHRERQFGASRGLPTKKLPRIVIKILRGLMDIKRDLRSLRRTNITE